MLSDIPQPPALPHFQWQFSRQTWLAASLSTLISPSTCSRKTIFGQMTEALSVIKPALTSSDPNHTGPLLLSFLTRHLPDSLGKGTDSFMLAL